jgi:hypothetical protein
MKIGYHDQNGAGSALAPAIIIARCSGLETISYDSLPDSNQEIPETFLINPLGRLDSEYWNGIIKCVQSHPKTHFAIIAPGIMDREQAQAVLADQKNVEYISLGEASDSIILAIFSSN